jgi:radical SAM-linked protein
MIIFRYSKLGGAEYISHLDTLRHIGKTLVRAKIEVAFSQGFNPHMQVYLSPPVFVGLKTMSEYCLVETDEKAESFKEKFNKFSPKGIKCITAFEVTKKHKIAGLINGAKYAFEGMKPFDVNEILSKDEIFVEIKGEMKEVRKKIFNLEFDGETLIAQLAFGNNVLRADIFSDFLEQNFSKPTKVIKLESYIDGNLPEDVLS